MQIERKKLSNCLIPGASYNLWDGSFAVALTCNTLLQDKKIYHTYQLGDCENCDGFEKLDITQFSQSPLCFVVVDEFQQLPAHVLRWNNVIRHNGKPYAIFDFADAGKNQIRFDLIELETFERDSVTLSADELVDWYVGYYPIYPEIGIKTYRGYEVKAVDLTDPIHCVLCDVDGVEAWLPAEME